MIKLSLRGAVSRMAIACVIAGASVTTAQAQSGTPPMAPTPSSTSTGSSIAPSATPTAQSADSAAPQSAVAASPRSPSAAAAPQSDEQTGLDDIIVTAQKRGENLQDVPISITAVDAKMLERRAVGGTLDLQSVIPGFQSSQVNSAATPALRSIGSNDPSAGNEGSVALYVDGVYFPTQNSGAFAFADIERVEVLKGPQGTLFGRNATAGLINIITRTPSATPGGELTLGYGNYDTYRASGYLTGGIVENVAASLSFIRSKQSDGWGKNLASGRDVYKSEETGVRGKIYATPGPSTTITLSADYDKQHNDVGNAFLPQRSPRYTINTNLTPRGETRDWGASGRIAQDLGFASLVSVTAYRDNMSSYDIDQDRSPVSIVNAFVRFKTHSFTQELQLVSNKSGKLEYILGGFYMHRVASADPLTVAGLALAPAGFSSQSIYGTQTTRSLSGFAQATYSIFEHTRITGGLRYTSDRQRYEGQADLTVLAAPNPVVSLTDPNAGTKTYSKLTYRAALDQKIGATLLYASFDRGFKSGFYNVQGFPTSAVKPEVLDSFQIGVKGELFDRRLRFDAATFFYTYSDIQIVLVQNGSALGINAGKAKLNGYELNLTALPINDLNLTAGVTWLPKARYSSFSPCPSVTVPGDTCDGSRTIRSPKISLALGADYTVHTQVGNFTPSTSFNYSSSFPWVAAANQPAQPTFTEKAYGVINASLSWTSVSKRFNASIWAKNLNDANYNVYGTNDAFGNWTIPAAPRTFGGTVGVKF